MVSIKQLFEWFATGKFPTEAQFGEQFKSFWHKSEKLPIEQIFGLQEEIANVTTKFKGYYSTLAELQTAYPQSENIKDFFAWVGSPYPGTVWKVKVDGGAWTNTGQVPTQEEIDLTEYAKKEELTPINDDLTDILGDGSSEIDIDITWVNGYYVDLNGVVSGGGTNDLYKLSEPIAVEKLAKYKAHLQAGNLLAVSGWTNGVFNNALAIAGTDTNNPADYPFVNPNSITHVRLTCRKELANPSLKKTTAGDGRLPVVENKVDTLEYSYTDLESAVFKENDGAWVDVAEITWINGYYVDLNGAVLGGGTNTLYKLSEPIAVEKLEKYKAHLQAGNLLAVSGWTNGVFNNALAIAGTDTNNPADYPFSSPDGITHVRLTCRKELANPSLKKYDSTQVSKTNRIDEIEKDLEKIVNKTSQIAGYNNFTGNNIITGNNTIAGGGLFQYPVNIAIEDLDFVAKINVKTANSEFGLCRYEVGRGTALVIKSTSIEIRLINSTVGSVIYTYALPFSIEAGKVCIVRMYKQNKDVLFSISVDSNIFVGFAERLDNKDFGRNWGYPSVFCLNGQIEIQDVFIRKSNFESPSSFCVGDSFIEGWGVVDNLDKRYIALMQQVTNGNVEISGRGGETTASLLARFDTELVKMNSDYVLLAIGTNDSNLATFQTNIKTLINKTKAVNKTPILVTITPRAGFPIVDMNSFVRNSSELYIDMNKAVNNGTETSWNPIYVNSDNVHPNIAGNDVMFKRILFDLYSFFDTKNIYTMFK